MGTILLRTHTIEYKESYLCETNIKNNFLFDLTFLFLNIKTLNPCYIQPISFSIPLCAGLGKQEQLNQN